MSGLAWSLYQGRPFWGLSQPRYRFTGGRYRPLGYRNLANNVGIAMDLRGPGASDNSVAAMDTGNAENVNIATEMNLGRTPPDPNAMFVNEGPAGNAAFTIFQDEDTSMDAYNYETFGPGSTMPLDSGMDAFNGETFGPEPTMALDTGTEDVTMDDAADAFNDETFGPAAMETAQTMPLDLGIYADASRQAADAFREERSALRPLPLNQYANRARTTAPAAAVSEEIFFLNEEDMVVDQEEDVVMDEADDSDLENQRPRSLPNRPLLFFH